ncbi:MAG: hypothetical protein NT002_11530 [candidate division Zixibacteria bacterium]|nr:hypothetical protein [candidate division Zixibacteria bacterium]
MNDAKILNLVLPYAINACAIGVIVMAIIQLFKVSVRSIFHSFSVHKWLHGGGLCNRNNIEGPRNCHIFDNLISLSTSGNAKSLFKLPLEQLCGQIATAAQVALSYPDKNEELLFAFVGSDEQSKASVEKYIELKKSPLSTEGNQDALIESRNRVGHAIQRNIDSLQVSVGYRWRFYLKLAAIVLSALLMSRFSIFKSEDVGFYIIYFATAIFAGYAASIARDIVAAVERVRR